MKTITGFKLRQLGNEFILVGESIELINFNKMITLNETAAFLWLAAEEQTVRHGAFTAAELCKALCDEYDSDAGGEWIPDPDRPGTGWQVWQAFTDLRGAVPESVRHPIARLIMFADVLAHMTFEIDGSSAN